MENGISVFGPFSVAEAGSGVAVAIFDVPGERQNVLRADYLVNADAILDYIESRPEIKGLVIESGKEESFIAGADVRMLTSCTSAEDAAELSLSGQKLFNRLDLLRIPVVAAIHGACLGGGLELALACDARICSDSDKTVLGLPEVQLGLVPGSGGTQRLPRLIGIREALRLMLTGRRLSSHRARRVGLVDEVVSKTSLRQAAVERMLSLIEQGRRPSRSSLGEMLLESNPVGRKVVFSQARKSAREKSGGHYPAPLAIIDCVETGFEKGFVEGLAFEAQTFGVLSQTSEAKALMGLFLATTELKSATGVETDVQPGEVRRIGILGAGLMGSGIAYVSSARAGLDVRLKDRDHESLAGGLKYIAARVEKSAARKGLSEFERNRRLERVTTTTDYSGFDKVDLVIEAVFEDLELKRRMVAEVEEVAPGVIFATNTSSIPVSSIAAGAKAPDRIVGMHYFSPVEKMPLLEVVAAGTSSDRTIATAVEVGRAQGKTVIVVKDGPGFYVNRILAPYLNEAAVLLREGVPMGDIDRSMRKFGFPLGPFELMDEVGLDVASKVVPVIESAFGDRMRSTGVVETMAANGRIGKKAGKGFYSYGKDGRRGDPAVDLKEILDIGRDKSLGYTGISDRCIPMMVGEAIRCLSEGIIRNPRDGDVGAVFGIGFPPFIGGPFRYVDLVGSPVLAGRMSALAAGTDGRFEPPDLLKDMAEDGRLFHEV